MVDSTSGFHPTETLNPAQQEVLDLLGAKPSERPEFDAGLRFELRGYLEANLEPLVETLDQDLYISKHQLGMVHGCEARYLAERDSPFEVTIPVARGTVAHKAIELSVHWKRELVPLELVDEALARLTETDNWLADFLRTCSEAELAELRGEAGERVTKFVECWPRLKTRWVPVTESRLRVELFDGRIVYQGKVDLALGRSTGTTAGKVIVDFKSGGTGVGHRDDLRFYGLLETIRMGVPPRQVANYYLDQGAFLVEDVSVDLLKTAAKRTIDGTQKIVRLVDGTDEPTKQASGICRFCPLFNECDEGQRYVEETDW